jgi:hypothetical protein
LLTLKGVPDAFQEHAAAAVLVMVGEPLSRDLEVLSHVLEALLVDREDLHWLAWSQVAQQHLHKG